LRSCEMESHSILLTKLLVPGDVVLLVADTAVPADIDWLDGDILKVVTAPLTGEPIPTKYPSKDHGKLILAGTNPVILSVSCDKSSDD
jgi:magnesium-transporting ATPase (P-type)